MKEPFILNEHLLFLNPWMSQNKHLVAGFSTNKGGVSVGAFEGLNIAYHVGDKPEAVLKNRQLVADHLKLPLENGYLLNNYIRQMSIKSHTMI